MTTAITLKPLPLPCWPALLQQQGADELLYLASQEAWRQLQQESGHLLNPGDRLLDSAASQWRITLKPLQLIPAGRYQLDELQPLVQRHALLEGNCCLSKLQLHSIHDAMALMKSLA
ncbi:DUF4144 family protein [Shewanella sp. YIC-542]|uniref:DUF4144 family protein n=1 Tax=Shewanella mytili TaxID=3377111 RepID=UPI00398F6902